MKPRHLETLADGTWLAELRPGGNAVRDTEPLTIRVIDYELDDGRANATAYRLFTTLLDPVVAPAVELAVAYAQRWEIESTFDELKTHQRGPRTVLRSKSPLSLNTDGDRPSACSADDSTPSDDTAPTRA